LVVRPKIAISPNRRSRMKKPDACERRAQNNVTSITAITPRAAATQAEK
jgi:hypothetical protein